MANSSLKCPYCGKISKRGDGYFHQFLNRQFCSKEHFIEYAAKNRESLASKQRDKERKAFNAETRKRNEETRPRSWYLKEAQHWFNKFIRLRDKGQPCISCGKPDDGSHQRHASHFRSVGACSSLRYNEINVWASCSVCNNYLSGNLANYRIALVEKIGLEKVEWIESQPKAYKWKIDDLKALIAHYKAKCKELEK